MSLTTYKDLKQLHISYIILRACLSCVTIEKCRDHSNYSPLFSVLCKKYL